MAHRDIVVVGASFGGVEALQVLASSLPAHIPASVLVVLHVSEGFSSQFAHLLDKVARLPFVPAVNGEPILPGRGYVAVPGHHLMVESGRIRLSRGPREAHARPSIDVLFRSAAYEYGRRVIGIVLTGRLDDGTAGLWAVKDRGGIAIVQSPDEAVSPEMPLNALKHVNVDHRLRLDEMANALQQLTRERLPDQEAIPMSNNEMEAEVRIAKGNGDFRQEFAKLGKPTVFTCPHCHGSMHQYVQGTIQRYRCHTGHAFSDASLEERQRASIEATLAGALALVEEHEVLLRDVAGRLKAPKGETPDQLERADTVQRIGAGLRQLIDAASKLDTDAAR